MGYQLLYTLYDCISIGKRHRKNDAMKRFIRSLRGYIGMMKSGYYVPFGVFWRLESPANIEMRKMVDEVFKDDLGMN